LGLVARHWDSHRWAGAAKGKRAPARTQAQHVRQRPP
jgi:hypothetical protein